MSGCNAVAQIDEIDEIDDGRVLLAPLSGSTSASCCSESMRSTAHQVGDRLMNEYDESADDSQEELYLVQRGRATFELDGERLNDPVVHCLCSPCH